MCRSGRCAFALNSTFAANAGWIQQLVAVQDTLVCFALQEALCSGAQDLPVSCITGPTASR